MNEYNSIKKVKAEPMTAGEYKRTKMPHEGDPAMHLQADEAEGYKVHYSNNFASWSPKKAFDEGYVLIHKPEKACDCNGVTSACSLCY